MVFDAIELRNGRDGVGGGTGKLSFGNGGSLGNVVMGKGGEIVETFSSNLINLSKWKDLKEEGNS